MTVVEQLKAYNPQKCNRAVLFFETVFERQENAFAGKEKTGADGRDRSLSLQKKTNGVRLFLVS